MAAVLLEHVAEKAKVSSATVSIVLNNKSSQMRISEATKKRVIQVARDLQYHPNFAARLMAKQRTSMIGVAMQTVHSMFDSDILIQLQEEFERHQYSIVSSCSEGSVEKRIRHLDTFVMKRMDGIIVLPIFGREECPESIRRYVLEEGKPVITILRKWHNPSVPYVVFDEMLGGYLGAKHLLDLGHRRIGIVHVSDIEWGSPAGNSISHDRYLGYEKAYTEASLEAPKLIYSQSDEDFVQKVIKDGVTAVMGFEGSIATIRMMKKFVRHGIEVPRDISVINFGDVMLSSLASPSPTTVARARRAGQVVAGMLFDMIEGKKVEGVILRPELVEGESCSRPPRQDRMKGEKIT